MGQTLYRDLVMLLNDAGCKFVRPGKGSLEIWRSPITNGTGRLPTNVESRHTANEILKQSGLPKKF